MASLTGAVTAGGTALASLSQSAPLAAGARTQRETRFGTGLALAAYVASIAFALTHLDAGGLEALGAAAAAGVIAGAASTPSRGEQLTMPARVEHVLQSSFAAMWAAFMLAGLLHVPLHTLFDLIVSAWR